MSKHIRSKKEQFTVSRGNVSAEIKQCQSRLNTIVFSFKNLCTSDNYNFKAFRDNKSQTISTITQMMLKLQKMSCMTWNELIQQRKNAGVEYLDHLEFRDEFINSLPANVILTQDEKLPIVRFNGQNMRLILKKGTQCPRVVYVLGIDMNLSLYKH